MIIKNIPKLIYAPEDGDSFVFDRNGRFIYIYRSSESTSKLFVYDLMFNSVVQLNPGPSIISFKNEVFNFGDEKFEICEPINTDKLLFAMHKSRYPGGTILLGLIHLNFKEKTYELLDSCMLTDRRDPLLVFNGENLNKFGLFCNTIVGREGDQAEMAYTLQMFRTNESNNFTIETLTQFQYDYYSTPGPEHPYLFQGKLWFIRRKYHTLPCIQPQYMQLHLPPSPTHDYKYISYFNLNSDEGNPKENVVDVIKIDDNPENEIGYLKYYGNVMIYHTKERDFHMFNLETHEWRKIESYVNFHNFYHKQQQEEYLKWTSFCSCGSGNTRLSIDKNFEITSGKSNEKAMYKVPLRSPLTFLDLTWASVLNAGHIDKILLIEKSPYKRLF